LPHVEREQRVKRRALKPGAANVLTAEMRRAQTKLKAAFAVFGAFFAFSVSLR
jgi:hypothetical protein